jgi:hypothetical protein
LHGEERHELLEKNDFRCAACGERGNVEWDHVNRLSTSFGEQEQQPLCSQCHQIKTADEPREYDSDPLLSHFNSKTWNDYVLSERPPPLIYKHKEVGELEGLRIADVRRCRKRALEYNVHDIPVFSVFDDIVELVDYTLGDINYVKRPVFQGRDCVKQLGYTGPGWQHRVLTEWLLYTGAIVWSDVSHKITATGRLPHDIFRKPLETMEKAWEHGLGKQSINSMIGLWCLDESFSYKLFSSDHPDDAPPNALKKITYFPGGAITDYITKTQLTSTTSLRPLHDLAMCTEAVRVGQMLYILRKQHATIYELKTDSVLYKPTKKAKAILGGITFADLRVRDLFETPNGQLRLDEHQRLPIHHSSEKVFRDAEATEKDPMKMSPQPPNRYAPYVHSSHVWRDVSEEEAERIVIHGGSLLCLGVAGTGKTTLLKDLVEKLRSLEKRVDVIAKTHTAAARAGGVTADHYVRRHVLHGACLADTVWVDEISQLECTLWAQLNKLKGKQWLLSGDENQFPPIYNSWRGCSVDDAAFWESGFLHELAGGNRIVLRECRRSDAELFNFYSSLIKGGARWTTPLPAVLAEARALFTFDGVARHNLVISHRKRVRINREVNQALRPEGAILVRAKPARGQLNHAQNMFIWEGIELLGCTQASKKGVRNNVLYQVIALDEEVHLQEKGTENTLTLTFAQVASLLRLSFAQTYASVQGTEFDDTLMLHDCDNKHFSMRHLFVAVSRARSGEKIGFAK